MNKRFIRVYENIDISGIKNHLLIYGDLSANCANCQAIDIRLDAEKCPACQTDFKYIAFRNIRHHLPKLQKLREERPRIVFVDYDDYAKMIGAITAQEFLK